MRYLFDTHILLWALSDDSRLPDSVRDILKDGNNEIYYSVASIWEILIKHHNHPDEMRYRGEDFDKACTDAGYVPLIIKREHVLGVERLRREEGAPRHSDPFDRIMLSQADSENMIFVSHDSMMKYYRAEFLMEV